MGRERSGSEKPPNFNTEFSTIVSGGFDAFETRQVINENAFHNGISNRPSHIIGRKRSKLESESSNENDDGMLLDDFQFEAFNNQIKRNGSGHFQR